MFTLLGPKTTNITTRFVYVLYLFIPYAYMYCTLPISLSLSTLWISPYAGTDFFRANSNSSERFRFFGDRHSSTAMIALRNNERPNFTSHRACASSISFSCSSHAFSNTTELTLLARSISNRANRSQTIFRKYSWQFCSVMDK